MDIEKIETLAHAEMAARQDLRFREPGWIFYHGKRTGKIAVHLAEVLNKQVDPESLYVAGLFHDIGKGQEHHHEFGAKRTRQLLAHLAPQETLDVISNAVRLHNQRKRSDDFSDTVKLIQDADLVDHVGLIDIWMAFYWNGSHGESIHEHVAWFRGEECKSSREYMQTHLNYDLSRTLLEERIHKSNAFFSEFQRIYFEGI